MSQEIPIVHYLRYIHSTRNKTYVQAACGTHELDSSEDGFTHVPGLVTCLDCLNALYNDKGVGSD